VQRLQAESLLQRLDAVVCASRGPTEVSRLARTAGLGVLLLTSAARAEPQTHVAWRTAVCGAGSRAEVWSRTRFCNALFADVLLLRERNRDFGVGPYIEISTAGFWDARFGGGTSVLLPVSENFPLVVSLGLYDHALEQAALGASVFWGARSYNFGGAYNYAFGVYASAQRDLGGERDSLVSVGIEIDGFFLLAPFILATGALR
jgi:hypothetical protein